MIERFCSPRMSELPHLVLSRVDDLTQSKMISVSSLLGDGEFKLDQRDIGHANPTENRRRRHDVLKVA